jgi:hypothetical protein
VNPHLPAPKASFHIVRFLFTVLAAALMALTAFAVIRAGIFYSFYTWLFARVVEYTGFDVWVSRAITIAVLTLVWSIPWQVFVLPWMGRNRVRVAALLFLTSFALVAMELVTRDVYFSRANGRPLKYYIQTLDGYKFSATPGTDPVYGIPYRPITQEMARTYIVWRARGGQMQDPSLPEGLNFNPGTGEALRWYARRPDGRIDLFTLPGFHPTYGTSLAPATADIVAAYQKQKAESDRQRQVENEKQKARDAAEAARKTKEEATRKAREERKRKIIEEVLAKRPLRPGRYLLPVPCPTGTVNGFRFTLTEVDLAADKALLHLDVDNIDPPWSGNGMRLGILNGDGTMTAHTAIRPKEGHMADRSGAVTFPGLGKHGAFIMEFESLDKLLPTFSLVVNDQPLFSGVNLRKAAFTPF